jgi:SAM-dependent methyltransferase
VQMYFDVAAASYRRFMGRFSEPLAELVADAGGVRAGQRVLDVGCGPGTLTAVLVDRVGAASVSAIDPSEPFVAAARARFPEVEVLLGAAEDLPYPDALFDVTLAELVVHFMTDPITGLREMGRVTRPGGIVTACVWDLAGDASPLSTFWNVVAMVHPDAENESGLPGAREGELVELARQAGLNDVRGDYLTVSVLIEGFADWWEPYTLGVGPAGAFVASLDDADREEFKEACRAAVPDGPFTVDASAWSITATAG